MRTTQCAVRSMRPLLASICGFVAGENMSIHVHCACACATFRFSRACVRGVSLKPSATRKTIFLVLYQFVSVDALRKRDPHQQKETSLMSLPWNLEVEQSVRTRQSTTAQLHQRCQFWEHRRNRFQNGRVLQANEPPVKIVVF